MPLYYPPSQNLVQKTLGAGLSAGVTAAATLNNVTGLQNKPGIMVIDRVDTNNVSTPTKREYIAFSGTSGSTVTTLTRNVDGSGTDQDHAIGAIVEFIPDVMWADSLSDALANLVDTTTLAVDTTKIVDLSTAQTLTNKTLASPNLSLGSDAHGDMYLRASGASLARLAKGTYGQRLQMTSTLPGWSYQNFSPWNDISDAAIMYIDFSLGNKFKATIVPSGSRTFLATNATVGSVGMLRIQYASTASLALGLLNSAASISLVHWPSGTLPTPTATISKSDTFGFACYATNPAWDAYVVGQNM